MKTFFVLCVTLSILQVIFIGESTAQLDDYQEYIPYNNYRRDQSKYEQQPTIRKRGISLLDDTIRMPADLVENVGSRVRNNVASVHEIADNGVTKLTDLGNGLTDRIINTVDSGRKLYDSLGNVANGVFDAGAELPRRLMKESTARLTNFPSFNYNKRYQDELANRRRLSEE